MNNKKVWRKLFGFEIGDKVRIVNPHLASYNHIGRVTQVISTPYEILYEVEIELAPLNVIWALFRKEELELVTDESEESME